MTTQAYDCTDNSADSRGGLTIMTTIHNQLLTVSDEMYAMHDAAMPFGQGYARYWVSEEGVDDDDDDDNDDDF